MRPPIAIMPSRGAAAELSPKPSHSLVDRAREEFDHCAAASSAPGSSRRITCESLARRWLQLAEDARMTSGSGVMTVQDKQAIALSVCQVMQEMDLTRNGWISLDEWIHFALIAQSGKVQSQIDPLLRHSLLQHPRVLVDLQEMFEAADAAKSGSLSFAEIVELYTSRLWGSAPERTATGEILRSQGLLEADARRFAQNVLEAADLEGDDRVTYGQFMAYCLGRQKHEVTLHLYDLFDGAAERISPWVLGHKVEGIWHTGVVAFGYEYYFTRDTVYDTPGATSFGTPHKVLKLVYTLWHQDELHNYIVEELKPTFHRGTYDVVNNNCNHFSDRVCMYLCGKHLPEEVMNQPQYLMSSGAVRLIRPMLNWYLRDGVAAR